MYSLWLDPLLYLAVLGLVVSAVMFGYFVRAWRRTKPASAAAAGSPAGGINVGDRTMPSGEMSMAAMFLKNVHDDILLFNDRIQSLEHTVSERNFSQERQIGEVMTNLNSIMDKLENLEPQIQRDLQPQLQSLGRAMESLRTSVISGESGVSQPAVGEYQEAAVSPASADLSGTGSPGPLQGPPKAGQTVVAEEPAVREDAVAEEPAVDQPVAAEEPAVDQPVAAEEPAVDQPVAAEEPAVDQPVAAEEPTVDQPVAAEEPAAEEPAVTQKRSPDEPPPDPLTGDSKSVYPV